jgi:predicted nucleic acid-binding protein
MNEWLVLDASVIAKAFVAEPDSQLLNAILASDPVLAAPAHALAEVGEVLRRKRALGQMTAEQLDRACDALPAFVMSVELGELFAPAMEMAQEIAVSFYDCLYVAAADQLDCRVVTADRKLVTALQKHALGSRLVLLDLYQAPTAH